MKKAGNRNEIKHLEGFPLVFGFLWALASIEIDIHAPEIFA